MSERREFSAAYPARAGAAPARARSAALALFAGSLVPSGAVLAASVLVCGCSLLPLGGRPTSAPGGAVSAMDEELREYKAVVHCHSHLSHDSEGEISAIAAAAAKLGIDAVFLTDHYEPGNIARAERGLHAGVLIVPGAELRLTGGGSILALGARSDFDKRQDEGELLAGLERDGAFLAAGHVERISAERTLGPFSALEIYNLHAEFNAAPRFGLVLRLFFYPIDCFFQSSITTPVANLARWDRELSRGTRLAAVAGHDAHENVRVFGPLGGTIGTYREIFRLFSTRILAHELTEAALLEALRLGRSFVVFDYLGDGAGFSMRYGPLAGPARAWAIVGDRVPLRPGARLEIRLPAAAGVRLLRDGRVVADEAGSALVVVPDLPGVYRVEVYRNERLWIAGSPLYIDPPPGAPS